MIKRTPKDARTHQKPRGNVNPEHVVRNTKVVGSPVASCPKKEATRCALKSIEIGPCRHKSALLLGKPRTYKFVTLSEDDDKNGDGHKKDNPGNEYHVIAGDKESPDHIQIRVNIRKPLCATHKPQLIEISDDGSTTVNPNQSLSLSLKSPSLGDPKTDLLDFVRNHILLHRLKPREYHISTNACDGSSPLVAKIKAYPDLEWEIEFKAGLGGVGWSQSVKQQDYALDDRDQELSNKTSSDFWNIDGSVTLKHDGGKPLDLTKGFKKSVEDVVTTLKTIKEVADNANRVTRKFSSSAFSITFPNLALKYKAGFEEVNDRYRVDRYWELALGLNPLIGINGETDILDRLIDLLNAIPGYGTAASLVLKTIKEEAAEGIGSEKGRLHAKAVVSVILSVGAQILGDVSWKKQMGENRAEAKGEVKMEVPFKIEGKAGVEGHIFRLAFKQGIKADGQMAVGYKKEAHAEEEEAYLVGYAYFSGLIFHYAKYKSRSFTKKTPESRDPKVSSDGETTYDSHEAQLLGEWRSSGADHKEYIFRK